MKNSLIAPYYCVIGGGIIGSWTALHLVRAGVPTVLIEQFPFEHARGSSHGGSRAFRMLQNDDLTMLIYSLSEWKDLEKGDQGSLFIQTGLISFGEEKDPYLLESINKVKQGGYQCKLMGPEEIRKQYPMIRYPNKWSAAYDKTAGILVAGNCVNTVKNEFSKLGGKIVKAFVKGITSEVERGANVHIYHPSGHEENLSFKKVVACAGPWTSKMFPQLRPLLTTKLIPVTYWQELNELGRPVENPKESMYSAASGFPVIFNARLTDVYAIPSYEYPGLMKVLYHGGPDADPDARDKENLLPYIAHVSDYIKKYLPNLDYSKPAILERCMYTCTTDNLPILDEIEENIIVGAGFSGSGFKHSPAMGKSLASLALGQETALPDGFELPRYKLNRF